jgi:hypothetical protein
MAVKMTPIQLPDIYHNNKFANIKSHLTHTKYSEATSEILHKRPIKPQRTTLTRIMNPPISTI